MNGYTPLKITGMETGLVESREEFILPDDAYPVLQNAYVWREKILRKNAYQFLGRLQRSVTVTSLGLTAGSLNLISGLSLESSASIAPGSISLTGSVDGTVYTDPLKNGTLTATGGTGTGGTINYATGVITINSGGAETLSGTIQYYPNLPVMGIRTRDQNNATNDQTVFWDTKYAYVFNGGTSLFQEFLPGTNATWSGTDYEFFWTTNFWLDPSNNKIFWATNYSASNDPIRYTNGQNGTNWQNFSPKIDASNNLLLQCLALLPFRGRLIAFNTNEGLNFGSGLRYTNRIRWAAIGTPFTVTDGQVITSGVNANAWRQDIRGQGGFLDIPTNEDIVSVGFVRDNLVIYTERSTWQLRYTGRTIQPFQIERVNAELGTLSTFGSIQFDTSLVGIGDKGIVECDSYQSKLIDIKIPDFVFNLQNQNNGSTRIQGARDFINRLAYWTIPSASFNATYPDTRLVYNYENDSWATFTDSLTALGTFQPPSSRTWINTPIPWIQCNFNWLNQPATVPAIVGGNQQGFIEYLDELTTNDPSLYISAITGGAGVQIVITSPQHNMQTGYVIKITGIPTGTPFASILNGNIYGIVLGDNTGANASTTFRIYAFNSIDNAFNIPVFGTSGTYVGNGVISVRDNFIVQSKKFNFLDEGQNIKLGFLDILMNSTGSSNPGGISLNVFLDYNGNQTSNTFPQNYNSVSDIPDGFFNQVIPTTPSTLNNIGGTKFWQRVYCPTVSNFLTIQYTFNNAQMAGVEQTCPVQIDAQVLWIRRGGRMTQSFT